MTMGIRAKLLLWLVLVTLPIAAASLFAVNIIDTRLSERIEADLENTRRLETARIVDALTEYERHAESLASGAHVQQFFGDLARHRGGTLPEGATLGGIDGFDPIDPAADRPLQQLAQGLQRKARLIGSEILELQLLGQQGQVLGQTSDFTWVPHQPGLWHQVANDGTTRFGNAFRTAEGDARLGMLVPVLDSDGQSSGVLLLETRLGPVVDMVAKHERLGKTSEAHIAQSMPDGAAQFITPLRFQQDAAFDLTVPAHAHLPINQALSSGKDAVITAIDYRGVNSILAYETIPETGWVLVVKIDKAEAFAPVAEVRNVVVIAGLGTICTVLLGWSLFLHPLARRIGHVSRAAERVANGQYRLPIGDRIGDEISDLACSIDQLAADLDTDIRMRAEAERKLTYQAMHDELTGLFNRKHANEIIRQLGGQNNGELQSSVMFLDLDGFKAVNDVYGHATGDEVLISVARRLGTTVCSQATLARWGGDEFVVILPGVDESRVDTHMQQIRALFDAPFESSVGTHQLGCSIGVASSTPGASLNTVLQQADALMYAEKQARRTARSLATHAVSTVELALREARLETWYQPIVSPAPQGGFRADSAEVLVRIRAADGTITSPGEFMPEIQHRSAGRQLDRWVTIHALQTLAQWRRERLVEEHFRLSINLTSRSLNDPDLPFDLQKQLAALSIPPGCVMLEISEESRELNLENVAALRELGVLIAIDDLGIQHSNLDRLVELAPDVAKIDRSWLGQCNELRTVGARRVADAHTRVVLPALVGICNQLGMSVVAEGVECVEQLKMLEGTGVMQLQGYYFDIPRPAAGFIQRWRRQASEPCYALPALQSA